MRGGSAATLLALGLAELVFLAGLGWIPAAHRFPLPGLAVFGAAFVAYALAGWLMSARGVEAPGTLAHTAIIWSVAVALRLALLPLTPELSDDVYRYLWDGHVQLAGVNPYLHPPAAPEVEAIRTAWHRLVNNPDVPTIYPPLAQIAFVLIGLLGSSILTAKIAWVACDLATAAVLAGVARDTGRDPRPVLLLYLWAPLLVVEVAWSGHLEPLGLLAMALALRWASASRPQAAGMALGLATLTKFAPAAALPALVRRHGWRSLVAFSLTVGALYLPYSAAGGALFTGLRTYGEHWWFMKGPFVVLESMAGDPDTARRLAALLVVAVVAWTVICAFDLERALLWTLGAGMILTPTLHPWYVLWMLPMAALRGSRAWLLLGGLAFIGYFGLTGYQETGEWAQPALARAALWVPFLIVLGLEARHRPSGEPISEGG